MAEPAAEDPAMAMEVLNPSQCWAFLRSAEVGRMAVVVDGEPEIFPLNYIVDHGSLVFRSAPGTKLAALDTTSLVAFEVDGYEPDEGRAWSVVVKGRAESIARPHAALEAGQLPLFPWQASPKPIFVRIEPTSYSGRRFRVVARTNWANASSDTPTTE